MNNFDEEILKDPVKQVKQKEEHEQKLKRVGQLKPHKGHKIYKYNTITGELSPAVFEEVIADFSKVLNKETKIKASNRRIIVEEGCVYVSALNFKNAMRKISKHYGVNLRISKTK